MRPSPTDSTTPRWTSAAPTASPDTACSNLHAGDLVAYNTKTDSICTLEDLHAEQKEFPHCIADGIFVLNEDGAKPGDDMAKVIGAGRPCGGV